MDGTPHLRLVGTDALVSDDRPRAARSVARENRAAARNPMLDPGDPRWVLAVKAQAQLQGAALSPQRREQLMRTARNMGMRDFDASMIIAIVQDHARRGAELVQDAGALGLLERPEPASRREVAVRWIAAIVGAVALNALFIHWLG